MKGKLKQKGKKEKGNAVLQKYMVAVGEFIKSKAGAEEVQDDRSLRFVKKKSRKELRKEKRKMKKARKKSHYEGKKTTSSEEAVTTPKPTDKQQLKNKKKTEEKKEGVSTVQSSDDPGNKPIQPSSKSKTKKVNRLQESRKRALLEANEDEDKEIKRLERCLGFNKRKNKKNLPQSFTADGLDYILGMLDSGGSASAVYHDDDDDMDTAKEKFEKLGEDEPQISGDDDDDEMSNEASDEGSLDENDLEEEEEESDEDEMVDEEEGEEMEDDVHENKAATSDDGSEMDEEEDADTTQSEAVGSEILDYRCGCAPDLTAIFRYPGGCCSR